MINQLDQYQPSPKKRGKNKTYKYNPSDIPVGGSFSFEGDNPKSEAQGWYQSVRRYLKDNPDAKFKVSITQKKIFRLS